MTMTATKDRDKDKDREIRAKDREIDVLKAELELYKQLKLQSTALRRSKVRYVDRSEGHHMSRPQMLDVMNYADPQSKHAVFGFMRKLQTQCMPSTPNRENMDIPDEVYRVVLAFFFFEEHLRDSKTSTATQSEAKRRRRNLMFANV